MKLIGFFYPIFLSDMWTTIGNKIYYPSNVTFPLKPKYYEIIKHEIVHVEQYKKYSIPLFLFLYLLFPLPIFFSYFRWKFEREAYFKINIKTEKDIEVVVQNLSKHYMKPWPKTWMRKWFLTQLERSTNGKQT